MARLTKKDWERLTKNVKFKGTIVRGVRWKPGDRKAKATTKAWKKQLGDKLPE